VSPTTRKRLEWIALAALMAGDVHYDRWPERNAFFGKTRFNGPQKRRRS